MYPDQPSSWQYLAEQARKEEDPAKMMLLIAKLRHALDSEREERSLLQRHLRNHPKPSRPDA